MKRLLNALLLGVFCLSCESMGPPGVRPQTETERALLGLRGPVRSLSIFRADVVKHGDGWKPQTELPVRTDRFDRRGHLIERRSYDLAGTLQERAIFFYDAHTNEGEAQRYGPENSLIGRVVSSYADHGVLAESRSYAAGEVLTERAIFQYDARGRQTEARTYQANGALKNRTASRYDGQGHIAEQFWYDAADTLVKKVVYHRDFRGTLVTRVSFVYAAPDRLRERTDVHFNNNGDPTERLVYVDSGRQRQAEMFSYRYDAFGNWTTQTVKRQVVNKQASYFRPTRIIFRVFEYYERGAGKPARFPLSVSRKPLSTPTLSGQSEKGRHAGRNGATATLFEGVPRKGLGVTGVKGQRKRPRHIGLWVASVFNLSVDRSAILRNREQYLGNGELAGVDDYGNGGLSIDDWAGRSRLLRDKLRRLLYRLNLGAKTLEVVNLSHDQLTVDFFNHLFWVCPQLTSGPCQGSREHCYRERCLCPHDFPLLFSSENQSHTPNIPNRQADKRNQ